MIGVAVRPAERETAREFFELCKTPWEFFSPGGQYDVVLCTGEPSEFDHAQLLLIYCGIATSFDSAHAVAVSEVTNATLSYDGNRLPIYGPAVMFAGSSFDLAVEEKTRRSVILTTRQRELKIARVGYNLFDEVRTLIRIGQPVEYAGIPTLELHIKLLRSLVVGAGLPFLEVPPSPDGYGFIACLSHDIDHPLLRNHCCDPTMAGFLYRATAGSLIRVLQGRMSWSALGANWAAAARLPAIYLGLSRDRWSTFDRYIEIEAGKPSTFFVIPQKGNPGRSKTGSAPKKRACRYRLNELTPMLANILDAGNEVAVHGIDAWLESDAGRQERAAVAQVTGANDSGVRMHWLYFDENSPAVLAEAGFAYDSSIGYNETVGYRAGTTQVFQPPGAGDLLELPLHLMDTALFYPDYLNLTEANAHRLVDRMIDDVVGSGGVLTVNWHDRSIAPERLWERFYRQLLDKLSNNRAWFATALRTIAWFRMRRSVLFESVKKETGAIKVRGRVTVIDSSLPQLKIRMYKPHPNSGSEPIARGKDPGFIDAPLNNTFDLSFAL